MKLLKLILCSHTEFNHSTQKLILGSHILVNCSPNRALSWTSGWLLFTLISLLSLLYYSTLFFFVLYKSCVTPTHSPDSSVGWRLGQKHSNSEFLCVGQSDFYTWQPYWFSYLKLRLFARYTKPLLCKDFVRFFCSWMLFRTALLCSTLHECEIWQLFAEMSSVCMMCNMLLSLTSLWRYG
jgi:hypothetical protein